MDAKALLGKNVRQLRKQQGLSQEQLAEKVGCSTKHIASIESGQSFVTCETLGILCSVLNTSPSFLFSSYEEGAIDFASDRFQSILREETEKMIRSILLRLSR